jgi:hypothetical protein
MVAGSPYNPVSMRKKVSESRASLPRRSENEIDEMFSSISPEASAYVSRNPSLRTKLLRAAARLGEAFPGRALHLRRYQDPESGDWDLFVEVERAGELLEDYATLRSVENRWIHDREDPKLEFIFGFYFGR